MADAERTPKVPPPEEGLPTWFTTYADFMSLLLCFFVMLFFFAKQDTEKYKSFVGSIQSAFGVQNKRPQSPFHAYSPSPEDMKGKVATQAEADLYNTLAEQLRDMANKLPDFKQTLKVETEDKGVVLRLSNTALFLPGTATLSPKAKDLLAPVIAAANRHNFNVLVRTNNTLDELDGKLFPSVWELSGARAAAAVNGLIVYGSVPVTRLRAMGMGDSAPLLPSSDPQSERVNNRTEFLFYLPGQEIW